jgi:hypothetical protein
LYSKHDDGFPGLGNVAVCIWFKIISNIST